jgi:hypothetical protein
MSKVNGLFQDKQAQTLKDRYFDYCEYTEGCGDTPMSLSEFAAHLADEIRDRAKYE